MWKFATAVSLVSVVLKESYSQDSSQISFTHLQDSASFEDAELTCEHELHVAQIKEEWDLVAACDANYGQDVNVRSCVHSARLWEAVDSLVAGLLILLFHGMITREWWLLYLPHYLGQASWGMTNWSW